MPRETDERLDRGVGQGASGVRCLPGISKLTPEEVSEKSPAVGSGPCIAWSCCAKVAAEAIPAGWRWWSTGGEFTIRLDNPGAALTVTGTLSEIATDAATGTVVIGRWYEAAA